MNNQPYGMGYYWERSRGKRLLTGALIGMAAGTCLGYALGRYAPGPDPTWPARFICRDVGGLTPATVRLCTLDRTP